MNDLVNLSMSSVDVECKINTFCLSTSEGSSTLKKRTYVHKTHRDLDMSSEEEEDEEDYIKGGYHPIMIGDVLNSRYIIKSKLGWGHFSTVWCAVDCVDNREIAIKIVKSASHYTEAARDEIEILRKSTGSDPPNESCVIHLLDHFDITGVNGLHVAMVFEKVGCNLLTLIRLYKYRGLPIPLVKMITKQILIGVDFLHKCLIIHTDLKAENVLLTKMPCLKRDTDQSSKPFSTEELLDIFKDCYKVKIVDLGNACWTYKHFSDDVQTRQYRAPEVILGAKYDSAIDIWSLACIVFELLTGDLLFEPKAGKTFEKNDDHLAQIQELLGKIPRNVALSGRHSRKFFNRNLELRYIKNLKIWPLKDVLLEKYKFSEKDASEINDFLLPMLNVSPQDRATARQCLQHSWIRNIDIDDFNTAF